MKKFIASSVTAATLLCGQNAFANDSAADMQQQLQELRDQLNQQKAQIEQLQGSAGQEFVTRDEARRLIENEMTVLVDQRVEAGMAQMRDSSPILTLGPNIDGLDIRGSIVFRMVRTETELDTNGTNSDSSEDSFQMALGIGGVWKSEGWEIGIGLTTGTNSEDTSASNGDIFATFNRSTVFESQAIAIDYAYAQHTWGDLTLTVGQMINPFRSTWMLWDPDLRPVGVAVEYGYQDFFVTAGGFAVRHFGADETEGYMGAIQVGVDTSYDQLDITAALAWYYFNDAATSPNTNGNNPVEDGFSGLIQGYNYNLFDGYMALNYNFQDTFTIGLFGQYVYNAGADGEFFNTQVGQYEYASEEPEDNNQAWILGASLGWQNLTLTYAYAHIEADALPASFADDEFGSSVSAVALSSEGTVYPSVNVEGHKVTLRYDVNENLSVEGNAFFVESIERLEGPGADGYSGEGQRYSMDLIYTF